MCRCVNKVKSVPFLQLDIVLYLTATELNLTFWKIVSKIQQEAYASEILSVKGNQDL